MDKDVRSLIKKETKRQTEGLELIPSENFVSREVLEANGSVFNNKYSEGYPHKRYYGGQEFTDQLEELAIKRAQAVFNTDYHINVQPYSGSPANLEVYFALLEFGDKVLGMSLTQGGHLTHGSPVNFSGRAYKFVSYGVGADETIDYDALETIALAEKPKMIVSGATAYPRLIDFPRISQIAKKINAFHLADISHVAGLVAAGIHPTPFGNADIVTTTTHKTLRGPRGAIICCKPELTEKIDKAVFPGMQGGPHMHQIAAKAVCFAEALTPEFRLYAKQIVKNNQALAGELIKLGHSLVSGGTDNHLILMKLKSGTGLLAQLALDAAGISVNRNTIPNEPCSPFYPSGIRLGTPAITSRGMQAGDMKKIASWINRAIVEIKKYELPTQKEKRQEYIAQTKKEIKANKNLLAIKEEIRLFALQFPLPGVR